MPALREDVEEQEQPAYVSDRLASMGRVRFERVITCGQPEISLVRAWHPTIAHMLDTGVFWYGDNLKVMRDHLTSDGEVDLIYLDPPFNSQRSYHTIFAEEDDSVSRAQLTAFEDYWRWGPEADTAFSECVAPRRKYLVSAAFVDTMQMLRRVLGENNMMAYLSMMAVRLIEMKRLLKPTGSIYLHCDPTASHYLKLILDVLFGPENFRNEIIWKRTGANNSANGFGPVHDVILFYAKTVDAVCHPELGAYSSKYLEKFSKKDAEGRHFQDVTLTGSGTRQGDSGKQWREFDITNRGRHWAIPGVVYDNYKATSGIDLHAIPLLERLDRIDEAGLLYWSEKGRGGLPRYKFYDTDAEGAPVQDVWNDIHALNSQSEERREAGYPTQKPRELLERIIGASSKEGDVVLDPFCGCGTAVLASQSMNRRWIGIDITHLAVSVLKRRLDKHFPGLVYRVRGEPEDATSARKLANDKPLEFQAWIVDKVGGIPVGVEKEKKVAKGGGDDNRDGFVLFRDDPKSTRSKRMLLSVKAGESYVTKPEIVDALGGALTRHGATCGALLVSHKPSDGTYKRAAGYRTWSSDTYAPDRKYPVIQIVTLDDIFADGWRGLVLPGENTSLKSQPPPGVPGASEELFDATGQPKKRPGVKKTTSAPPSAPGQIPIPGVPDEFRLSAKRGRK